jgi:hypothetical protein
MRVTAGAAVLVLALAAAGAAWSALGFQRVAQNSAAAQPNAGVGTYLAGIWTDAAVEEAFEHELTAPQHARLVGVDLDSRFVISVEFWSRTSGWSVAVKRVTLKRISRSKREFCIYVKVDRPKPGEAVLQRSTVNVDLVSLPSKRFQVDQFHWNIPKTFVLLSTNGSVLYRSREGGNVLSGIGAKITGQPRFCK